MHAELTDCILELVVFFCAASVKFLAGIRPRFKRYLCFCILVARFSYIVMTFTFYLNKE